MLESQEREDTFPRIRLTRCYYTPIRKLEFVSYLNGPFKSVQEAIDLARSLEGPFMLAHIETQEIEDLLYPKEEDV